MAHSPLPPLHMFQSPEASPEVVKASRRGRCIQSNGRGERESHSGAGSDVKKRKWQLLLWRWVTSVGRSQKGRGQNRLECWQREWQRQDITDRKRSRRKTGYANPRLQPPSWWQGRDEAPKLKSILNTCSFSFSHCALCHIFLVTVSPRQQNIKYRGKKTKRSSQRWVWTENALWNPAHHHIFPHAKKIYFPISVL